MDEKIVIKTSDFAIGKAPQLLITAGVGSCVVICFHDKEKKVGALLHCMLPSSKEEKLNPLRFANTGIALVLGELEQQGVSKQNLVAKLIGGAHMFKVFDSLSDVGARNVQAVKQILASLGIAISSEDTGGNLGRSIEFNLDSGQVTIYTKA